MLSARAREFLKTACGDESVSKEVADALDAAVAAQQAKAATVAAIGTATPITGVDGTGSNAAALAGTNSRFTAVEGKVDAIIANMKSSGQML